MAHLRRRYRLKVYISADIEGVAGVVHSEQTQRDGREHDHARMLMTEEVNAVIRGSIEAGATGIIVNDSHGTMRNIYPDKLHPKACLLSGSPKKLAMVSGISEAYDAALFIGYHTKAGAEGVLSHTFSGKVIKSISVNSVAMGEFGLNALTAGCFGVPVVLTSGCHLLAVEAREFVPAVTTVITKETVSRTAALSISPEEARKLLQRSTKAALGKVAEVQPFVMTGPFTVKIELLHTGFADAIEILPCYKRESADTISFFSEEWLDCYRMIRGAIMIANSVG